MKMNKEGSGTEENAHCMMNDGSVFFRTLVAWQQHLITQRCQVNCVQPLMIPELEWNALGQAASQS